MKYNTYHLKLCVSAATLMINLFMIEIFSIKLTYILPLIKSKDSKKLQKDPVMGLFVAGSYSVNFAFSSKAQ